MNHKILLCDDDQQITQILEGFFLGKGYDMFTSLTGEDALATFSVEKPDLVIMDLKLPGINGVEVSRKIKETSPGTKIIVLSGYSDEHMDELDAINVDYVASKPINIKEITRVISDMLAGRVTGDVKGDQGTPKAQILIAEPHNLTATSFKEYFESYDKCGGEYAVDLIGDAGDLLNEIERKKPDFVLVSLNIPEAGSISSELFDKYPDEEVITLMISHGLDIGKVAKKIRDLCVERHLIK